jgi:hypothetical protein
MKQTLKIEIPTSWADITLERYIKMQTELDNYRDDEEAQIALMLIHLCKIQPEYLKSLSAESYNLLKGKLGAFISPEGIQLKKFITIDGREYGFEPNLSKMSYGAYADITANDTITIDKNWAKIMSILYRPVVSKNGDKYRIETYTGEVDERPFLKTDMETNWGALFFFLNLQMDLMSVILKSLKVTELPPNIQSIFRKSGEHIQQLLNSPMGISVLLTRS